jgi:hypothetical protein
MIFINFKDFNLWDFLIETLEIKERNKTTNIHMIFFSIQ